MKIDRMIGILAILLQHEKVTAPYLADKFEVSRRTINRDIEALCMAGIPLVTMQGSNGGVSIMDGYKIDRTLLTSSEMQAIIAGLRSLDSVCGTNRYAQLMEKLSVGASAFLPGDNHILIDLSAWQKTSLPPKIEMLHNAIADKRKIEFTYYSQTEVLERTIEPYNLVFQWSNWYVWGWCLLRKDFRLFKVNRMDKIVTKEQFQQRSVPFPDFSLKKVFPGRYTIKAIVQSEFKWRLVEAYGVDSFTVQDDGRLLFTTDFPDMNEALQWVFAFGDGLELIEPAELRSEIADYAEKIKNKYADT